MILYIKTIYRNQENRIITSFKSGFTHGDSTVNKRFPICNEIGLALDLGKEVSLVFCDISKVFERVWHRGLFVKIKSIGIRGNC